MSSVGDPAPSLYIAVAADATGIEFQQRGEVPSELWHALARNIAPGVRPSGSRVVVPIERFLASRNWLGHALRSHSCAVMFDEDVTRLLGRADHERDELGSLLSGTAPPSVDETYLNERLLDSRFQRKLKSFQARDVKHLLALSHGANFSVPGAGKTTVGYACYEVERVRERVDRLLVVAPLSAFDAWISEAVACLDPAPRVVRLQDRVSPQAEVVLVNYQRLASRYDEITRWILDGPTHVVLDEAHRMKRGRTGEWGRTCLDLAHIAVRRDILTGTPAPQHPRDLIAQMDFLWPHQAGRIVPGAARRADLPPQVMQDLSARLRPLFVRTKKDELDLRPPRMRVELVSMKPVQAEIYDALRTRMRHAALATPRERAMFGRMGEVVMYLLEAATNPALLAGAVGGRGPSRMEWPSAAVPVDSTLADQILRYGTYEIPKKFEKLTAMVATNAAAGRKTLVWSNFVGNLTELAENVLRRYHPAVIYGAIPSSADEEQYLTREAELRRFRMDDDCLVLLANPAAMSEGVSLHQVCHDAIYVDRTFNAGQYLQSIDRIHRLGLSPDADIRITFLVSTRTIDEVVDDRVQVKAERLSQMLSDPGLVTMALPDEDAYGQWIDAEDLDALFRHLEGDY